MALILTFVFLTTPFARQIAQAFAGDAGDSSIVPDMALFLKEPALQTSVEAALWAIFHRSSNPSVNELMNQVFVSTRK